MKLLTLFLGVALPALAQFSTEELLRPNVFTNGAGETIAYRMSVPQFPVAGKKYPLILFLHGSGECGTDNLRQIKVGVPQLMATLLKQPEPVIVLAPQCPNGGWWVRALARDASYAASHEPAPSLSAALELCRNAVASGLADSNRLYVTGLSLGGFGAWDAVQRETTLFAAAIPICGGGDIRRVQPLCKLPIWVFHGSEDKNVSVDCSRRMVDALRQAGSRDVRFTEYAHAAHAVWDRVYADQEVIDWLLAQNRAKKPWWRFW